MTTSASTLHYSEEQLALAVLHWLDNTALHEMFSGHVVHCCGMLCTTSWCKCSALNSGASLNRGRKFMTGISSRHESWQKIRHIPHPHHISTLSRPKNPWKEFQKYFVLYLFWHGQETVRKMPWDFSGAVLVVTRALLYNTTLSIGHQRHLYWLLKVTTWVKADWDPQASRPISLADWEINSRGEFIQVGVSFLCLIFDFMSCVKYFDGFDLICWGFTRSWIWGWGGAI